MRFPIQSSTKNRGAGKNSAQQMRHTKEISRTENGGKLIKARNMKKTVSTGPSVCHSLKSFLSSSTREREDGEETRMEGNWKEWRVFSPRDNEKVSRTRGEKREEKEKLMKKEGGGGGKKEKDGRNRKKEA